MSPLDALRVALRALVANRLRSGLAALGMIIGVSSVIVLIAVGQGAQEGVAAQIRGLWSDLVFVQPGTQENAEGGAAGAAATLSLDDADAVATAGIPGVVGVAPQLSIPAQAIGGDANQAVTVIGTTSAYPFVRDATVGDGSFVTVAAVEGGDLDIVLGSAVAARLYPERSPLGERVRISLGGGRVTFDFEVVGVMQERGGAGDEDNFVFIPVTTLQSRLGRFLRGPSGGVSINQINVKVDSDADQEGAVAAISDLLFFQHGTVDFTVTTQNDLLDASTSVSTTLSILLGSIAGISLLVGAIGVMNIMLVSVTERRREIGIRRAVGARGRDIVMQFVTEALTLSVGGGLLGILIGVGISAGIDNRAIAGQSITTLIQPWSIVVAFAVAATIGFLSGSYPAYRATSVDPITALRNE